MKRKGAPIRRPNPKKRRDVENSIQVVINGIAIVDMTDADKESIVAVLDTVTKTVDRFGLKTALKALEKSPTLKKAMFIEAQCGDALLSTIVVT